MKTRAKDAASGKQGAAPLGAGQHTHKPVPWPTKAGAGHLGTAHQPPSVLANSKPLPFWLPAWGSRVLRQSVWVLQ